MDESDQLRKTLTLLNVSAKGDVLEHARTFRAHESDWLPPK